MKIEVENYKSKWLKLLSLARFIVIMLQINPEDEKWCRSYLTPRIPSTDRKNLLNYAKYPLRQYFQLEMPNHTNEIRYIEVFEIKVKYYWEDHFYRACQKRPCRCYTIFVTLHFKFLILIFVWINYSLELNMTQQNLSHIFYSWYCFKPCHLFVSVHWHVECYATHLRNCLNS